MDCEVDWKERWGRSKPYWLSTQLIAIYPLNIELVTIPFPQFNTIQFESSSSVS